MLPGLRFFFAAVILSMSLLVFGLGAAALLRSAHEEVANLPARRAPAPAIFTQHADSPQPSLAMLRVDAGVADADDTALPFAAPATPPAMTMLKIDQAVDTSALRAEPIIMAIEPETAAQPAIVIASTETGRPAETLTASEPETPARPDFPVIVLPTQIALAAEPAFENQLIKAEAQPVAAPIEDSVRRSSLRIAILGGPAVLIETETTAKAAAVAARKAKARRIAKRRRFLARLRLLQQQQAQPVDAFAPAVTTAPTSRIASTNRTPSAGH